MNAAGSQELVMPSLLPESYYIDSGRRDIFGDDMFALKKLTETGRIKLSDLIDETHAPTEATEVYARLVTEKTFPLVQFDWRLLK